MQPHQPGSEDKQEHAQKAHNTVPATSELQQSKGSLWCWFSGTWELRLFISSTAGWWEDRTQSSQALNPDGIFRGRL